MVHRPTPVTRLRIRAVDHQVARLAAAIAHGGFLALARLVAFLAAAVALPRLVALANAVRGRAAVVAGLWCLAVLRVVVGRAAAVALGVFPGPPGRVSGVAELAELEFPCACGASGDGGGAWSRACGREGDCGRSEGCPLE